MRCLLSRRYVAVLVLIITGCIIGALIHIESQKYYKPQEYGRYKPLTVTVLPGHYAAEYGYKRHYDINNFSAIGDFVYHNQPIREEFVADVQVEEKSTTGTKKDDSNNINSSQARDIPPTCQPVICNEDFCFENLLCPQLPKFAKNFKNPCFYEEVTEDDSDQSAYKNLIIRRMIKDVNIPAVQNLHKHWQMKRLGHSRQIRCLPYFFLIGMEKCGTTDLYQRMSAHPDIVLSPAKELQWWTRRRFFYTSNNTFPAHLQTDFYKLNHKSDLTNVPMKHYYAFFDKVAETIEAQAMTIGNRRFHHLITGDGSPNIMYWNDFAEIFGPITKDGPSVLVANHIAAVIPNAKLICILRNPIERLYSSYLFFNRGVTKHSFHEAVERGLALLTQCQTKASLRFCVYDWKIKEDVGSTVNLMQGIYVVMLKDWLKIFPKDQLHVVNFDHYKKSELTEINKIFQFLDLETFKINSSVGGKIAMKDRVFGGKQYDQVGDMLPETRQLLLDFYRPYNVELAVLLGDQSYLWEA